MKLLVLAVLLVCGCETRSAAYRDAESWALYTMTPENLACFRRWEAQDPSAATAWLADATGAKLRQDAEAMGRSLDRLECMCGTSRFLFTCLAEDK